MSQTPPGFGANIRSIGFYADTDPMTQAKRMADVETMSSGKHTHPLAGRDCTKAEIAVLPAPFCPWITIEGEDRTLIFGLCHSKKPGVDPDEIHLTWRGPFLRPTCICVFTPDGETFPPMPHNMAIEVDMSPFKLNRPENKVKLIHNLLREAGGVLFGPIQWTSEAAAELNAKQEVQVQ